MFDDDDDDNTTTHVTEFTREVVTDNAPKARRQVYNAKAFGLNANEIRKWATDNGMTVARKGRLSRQVLDGFLKRG